MNVSSNMSPHIIVVGGGAGGLELVARLGRKLGKRKKAMITLVDANLTHLWKPLIHEVAAGTLDSREDELNYITYAHAQYFSFQFGSLCGLNRKTREIYLSAVTDEGGKQILPPRTLHYDYLVIAVGSRSNDFGTPGVQEFCNFIDSCAQAEQFHHLLLQQIMSLQNDLAKTAPLSIAIVGAGATGVELAAELHYSLQQTASYTGSHGPDQNSALRNVKIILIESQPRILTMLPLHIAEAVTEHLKKLGIIIYTAERVVTVNEQGLTTADGLFIPALLKVWSAGIKAPDFLRDLDGLEVNKINQLCVKQTLQTTRDERIFAIGDCASCPWGDNKTVPPRAQAAHQEAGLMSHTMQRLIRGKPALNYFYHDYGALVSLSYYNTVGNLMSRFSKSILIEGKLARLFYLSLYKMHQVVLQGWWRVGLLTLANRLTRRLKPRLKMH